jgi:AAA+ superfamily predicted ATPase
VAAKLKMPLLTARADSLVSSYLGSTSKNIRALFSAAASQDCILFLDELDAVGKARDDAHELGELKRVVIGLLQNIDSTSSRLILIAATNHQHLLDPAIWRRFPSHIRIGLPSQAFRLALFRRFLRGSLSESFEAFAQAAVGMSGAKIREIVTREQIQSVLHDEPLTTRGMMIALTLSGGSREPCPQTTGSLLRAIKQRNRAYFTNVRLANLLGLSRSEVSAHLRS